MGKKKQKDRLPTAPQKGASETAAAASGPPSGAGAAPSSALAPQARAVVPSGVTPAELFQVLDAVDALCCDSAAWALAPLSAATKLHRLTEELDALQAKALAQAAGPTGDAAEHAADTRPEGTAAAADGRLPGAPCESGGGGGAAAAGQGAAWARFWAWMEAAGREHGVPVPRRDTVRGGHSASKLFLAARFPPLLAAS